MKNGTSHMLHASGQPSVRYRHKLVLRAANTEH